MRVKKILSPEISRDGEPFFFRSTTRRLKLFYSQESVTTSKLNNSFIIWRNKLSSIAIATTYWWEKCFERFTGFDKIHVEQNQDKTTIITECEIRQNERKQTNQENTRKKINTNNINQYCSQVKLELSPSPLAKSCPNYNNITT